MSDVEVSLAKNMDNFSDGTISAEWITDIPVGGIVEANDLLSISVGVGDNAQWNAAAPYNAPCIYRAIRDGNFIYKIKLSSYYNSDGSHLGIMLSNGRGNVMLFGPTMFFGGVRMYLVRYNNGNAQELYYPSFTHTEPLYLRIRFDGTTYYFEYSIDDVNYTVGYSSTDLGFIPINVGMFCRNWNNDKVSMDVDYFEAIDGDVVGNTIFKGLQPTIYSNNAQIAVNNVGDMVFDSNTPVIAASNGLIQQDSIGEAIFEGLIPINYVTPLFFFENANKLRISHIDFESIYAGRKTEIKTITAVNNSSETVTVNLTPKEAVEQLGYDVDTYIMCCFLSTDGLNYISTGITFDIEPYSSTDFYIFYQPSSKSKIGVKQWELSQRNSALNGVAVLKDSYYAKIFSITGSNAARTNAKILLKIDFDSTKMNADFSDIRFALKDGTLLTFEALYIINERFAYFIVTLPDLPANPTISNIYVYCGNFTDKSAGNESTTIINDWSDGTLDPWIAAESGWPSWYWGPHASVVATNTWNNEYKAMLEIIANCSNWRGEAHVPSTQTKGFWRFNFKGFNSTGKIYFYFIANTDFNATHNNDYSVTIEKGYDNDTANISLNKNDSALVSTTAEILLGKEYSLTILRDHTNNIQVILSDVPILTVKDDSITTCNAIRIETLAIDFYPDWQYYYIYTVETNSIDNIGTLNEIDWQFYAIIDCRGEILYESQDIPGISREIRYGCKIGDNYYE